MYSAASAQFWR